VVPEDKEDGEGLEGEGLEDDTDTGDESLVEEEA
jgi:hypothetical protein